MKSEMSKQYGGEMNDKRKTSEENARLLFKLIVYGETWAMDSLGIWLGREDLEKLRTAIRDRLVTK